jgi:hypothetical protein
MHLNVPMKKLEQMSSSHIEGAAICSNTTLQQEDVELKGQCNHAQTEVVESVSPEDSH